MTRPKRSRQPRHVALAGWLFADLLLVLALVALSDRPDPLAEHKPTPSPSVSHSTHPPKPKGPRSLDLNWKSFTVKGSDRKSVIGQIRKATGKWPGRDAAVVQTFGGTNAGEKYAKWVNGLLHTARPEMFPTKLKTDNFLKLGESPQTASVRVYFYTT